MLEDRMAKELKGFVFERQAWFGAVEYKDENGKRQVRERQANSNKHAQDLTRRLLADLKVELGPAAALTQRTYKKSLGWYARVSFSDKSGKRRFVKRRADNKTEAKEIIKQLIQDLQNTGGAVVEGAKMSLADYFEKWLGTAAKPRLSERTYSDYEELFKRYVEPAMGRKRLSDIQPLDVQSLYSSLQEKGLSARTVRYTHAILNSALKQAVKWGLMPRNPAAMAELPKMIRNEMRALSPLEAAQFLEACDNDRWGIVFQLALATGMRPEEYLGLKWSDIDLERGIVTVQRTLCWRRKGGGYYFGEPKTSRSRRSIILPSSVRDALIEHRKKNQSTEAAAVARNDQILDLVFATSEGTPLMPRNLLKRHFKPILKSANLPETIRLYDLRHSCATLLLTAEENPKVVSERLGHANITLTLDTYSHVLPSMQQAASDKLEQMLFASKSRRKIRDVHQKRQSRKPKS